MTQGTIAAAHSLMGRMTRLESSLPIFTNEVLAAETEPGRMDELHLYHGARCNRSCAFCCVNGSPDGGHTPFGEPVLRAAVDLVARRGSLKIYGGEPTLDPDNLAWSIRRLREIGFEGAITIFSNGLRPRPLIDLLRGDDRLFVVLNHAIFFGRGEEPLSPSVRALLLAEHARRPGRLFVSHDFTVAVGRESTDRQRDGDRYLPCFRCWPTLTTTGFFHACPFAVEHAGPHFALGTLDTPPGVVRERFETFLRWTEERLNPEAKRLGIGACALCTGPAPPAIPRHEPRVLLPMV
ncbi:MAG: radical SAM protein [Capsulimonadales bacterium]|nr:radical SAM protein [Capsulimonadales bacterium]